MIVCESYECICMDWFLEESLGVDFGLNNMRAQCDVWMSSRGPSSCSLLVCTYDEQECIESKV